MPYCEKCGTPLNADASFCGNCGAPRKSVQQDFQPNYEPSSPFGRISEQPLFPTPTWQKSAEQILGFIIVNKPRKTDGRDYLTGIITTTQLIFVPMSKEMLKEVQDASTQSPEPVIAGSSTAAYSYQEMFLGIPPSAIVNQMPGSFAVHNASIKEINLKLASPSTDGYTEFQEIEMQIVTELQTFNFRMINSDEYLKQLIQVYRTKVKLPSN